MPNAPNYTLQSESHFPVLCTILHKLTTPTVKVYISYKECWQNSHSNNISHSFPPLEETFQLSNAKDQNVLVPTFLCSRILPAGERLVS